ncbi:M16 family metallopeptidase [Vulcaniibacterium tengchongense]|uniref:Putative Zn-dependent peptidase n=1 Tax=Vulcaniibacterium tengchongense TaxID=1273429 RepID=A0A3N4VLV7_9GAMM|nr:pitrilysin family protein [Vulcaniibacterium tengchongense]RPE80241.1 putative Zn-dependent peptidase [Vulcaniibacterium tengchongense]
MSPAHRPRAAALALALAAAFGGAAFAPSPARADTKASAGVDIPYEQFTLPNGLRVIVHTDRKAPIVAVNLWYHVGSKDEPAGRTGFAHLFEHLMFNGSENHKGEFFEPFELVGATDMNGTTNSDRTNYFENVPTTALDMALWMESDRMGHLLGAIDQKTLDEQRGVVQNEKRQGENQPYGQVWDALNRALYPKHHPYHHSTIGSMADLDAASLEDVKTWFRAWYGPNNAVLVLAGDIDVATAKEKVAQYFGDIPAGPSMAQPKVDVAPLAKDSRQTMTDQVPQARVYRAWNVAQAGTEDADRLVLLAQVLGGSKSSRLDRRLVHEEKLVDNVSAFVSTSQLSSNFLIMADVKQGVEPAKVEAVIDEEVDRLLREGPSQTELKQAQTMFKAGFVRGIERIGGFGGKADVLAECAVYTGDPGCFRASLDHIASASAADLRAVGAKWLEKGSHTLVVVPGPRTPLPEEPSVTPTPLTLPPADPKYKTLPSTVDRSQGVPQTTRFPELKFPALQRARLSNGTQVILAERHDIPVVQFSYEFDGGFRADQGGKLGTSSFAMGMLDEGAGELDALAFGDRAESLGATLGAGASLDGSRASLSALKESLDPSLALFAKMLREPRFEQKEIDRVKASWIAGIKQEKARPNGAALRVLPPLLYGEGHPYAMPFSGSGTEASIAALTREDLLGYHRRWLRPQGATLIVVGDTTLAEIVPLLEKHFGDWTGEGGGAAATTVPEVARPQKPRVFLIDQPGAIQANIFAGELVPSTRHADAVKFDIANAVLGGEFSSRLNMNLREDKHWAYGAYSFTSNALGQRPWLAFAPVQIDRTVESLKEMRREIADYASGKAPPTAAEVAKIQATEIRGLPGAYETASAVLGTIGGIVRYGRPDDYVFKRKAEIEALTPEQVKRAAATLDPNALTWVVVGDLERIEQPIRALDLGEVQVLDADGKPAAKR